MLDTERLYCRELITAQAVKDRVMAFFRGVDLQEIGKRQSGLLTIRTLYYEHVQEMHHIAELNGFCVAEYSHTPTGITVDSLPERQDRTTARYELFGYFAFGRMTSVKYEEYEERPAELIIYGPPTAGKTSGSPKEIPEEDQRNVAEVLGISI